MANVNVGGTYYKVTSTNGSNTYVIGTGSDSNVSAIAVQIVMAAASNASIVVAKRSAAKAATVSNIAFNAGVYHADFLNNAVGTGALVSTAITDNSNIVIPASGSQVGLTLTFSTGTVEFYITRVGT